jgi:hypothetical protein
LDGSERRLPREDETAPRTLASCHRRNRGLGSLTVGSPAFVGSGGGRRKFRVGSWVASIIAATRGWEGREVGGQISRPGARGRESEVAVAGERRRRAAAAAGGEEGKEK